MITERLNQAIQLIKAGKLAPARDLLLEEVKANPGNLDAWLWALEVAASEKEKRLILGKILAIDPSHQSALSYINQLGGSNANRASPPGENQNNAEPSPMSSADKVRSILSGLLKLLLDWVGSLPSGCVFIAIFIGIVAGVFIYTQLNTSLFGLAGADFDNLVISNSYELISSDAMHWELQFEGIGETYFDGTVRHISPIRIREFAILTHDILVTSGDFADPDIVRTNVIDHKFFWRSPQSSSPGGAINLIHAVPANKTIYQQLLDIQKWDLVRISGREILAIQAFDNDQAFLGTWLDTGCNTLLVESVTIVHDTE